MTASQAATLPEDAPVIARKSLAQAYNAAARGEKPFQPHAQGAALVSEAYIGQDILTQIGEALTALYPDIDFEIGPEKDFDRAIEKTKQAGDLSLNCDFSRGRGFTNVKRMKTMIDLFGKRGPVSLSHEGKTFDLFVVDVDNTFSTPNPKKPGLRNLDIKLLIPFTLEDGEETYHVCEFQCILSTMRKAWDESHQQYTEARRQMQRKQFLENSMDMLGVRSGTAYNRLKAMRDESVISFQDAMEERTRINQKSAKKAGADALIGYQPCNNDNAEFVALPPPKDYIHLVAQGAAPVFTQNVAPA